MLWLYFGLMLYAKSDQGAAEATDSMKPLSWTGNYWGPAATRARAAGLLPSPPTSVAMTRWNTWGRQTLRGGDIVFRLGDARTMRRFFPLSQFIARASGSLFSHTGIVAIENGAPVVYDCSSDGVQRQPFEIWMLDCVGSFGVKRLKPEHRHVIPAVIDYCRSKFAQEVPFDFEFGLDDSALYCVELTEKAFRSQGLALSQPVRIGDWERLDSYPLTAIAAPCVSRIMLKHPITLEQPVYLPGNERHGVWASPLLETVVAPQSKQKRDAAEVPNGHLTVQGDIDLALFSIGELRRSIAELVSADHAREVEGVAVCEKRP